MGKWAESVLLGSATGLLCIVRPQLLPAILPAAAAFAAKHAKSCAIRSCVFALPAVILALAGILQLLQFNFWMTGNPFQSHYNFGDGQFSLFNLSGRYIRLFLFSNTGGVFPSHPLIAAGVLCAITSAFAYRKRDSVLASYHLWLVFAIFFETWFLSGYYGWHGSWGFGSRYRFSFKPALPCQ